MADQDSGQKLPLRKLGPSKAVRASKRRGPHPITKTGRWVIGHPWSIIGIAAAVWFCVWVVGTRSEPHTVRAAFPTALNLAKGADVQIAGIDAGKISKVDYEDGRAVVELGISEEFWPLPQGTTAISRYGTTIGSGTRRVDLKLGPKGGKPITEGGIISAEQTQAAVDVDAVLNTADKATRGDATRLNERVRKATAGTEDDTNAAIAASGRGIEDIDAFLKDLGSDSVALSGLITNTDRLTKTLASRAPAVSDLVSVSARTFEAFAARTTEIQQTLDGVPPAMTEARSTLARVDQSLGGLTNLVNDVRPGAKRLKPLARAATPALRNLNDIVPTALSTVRTTTKVAPELNTLLTNGSPFLSKVERITKEATPIAHCVRPYAPEAAGAVQGLGSWVQQYFLVRDDNPLDAQLRGLPSPYRGRRDESGMRRQHSLRPRINGSTATLHAYPPSISTKAFAELLQKEYAYLRPPGLQVGEPWYQPECGITKDSLDPDKDPEEVEGK